MDPVTKPLLTLVTTKPLTKRVTNPVLKLGTTKPGMTPGLRYLTYNDDIQGTASVVVAAIMGAIMLRNPENKDLIGALKDEFEDLI